MARPKGAKNQFGMSAKLAFFNAFEDMGGYQALAEWAMENKTEFYRLYARLIPIEQQVNADIKHEHRILPEATQRVIAELAGQGKNERDSSTLPH